MEKPSFESGPKLQIPEEENKARFSSTEEILKLSPKEMAAYLVSVEEQGRLGEFLEKAVDDASLSAQLSYWEKWLEKDQQKLLESIIEKKKEIYPPKSESLPLELEKRFSEDELKLIFSNMKAMQLTFGCSIGCSFCGFDAIKGVREHIPYSQLANMFKKYGLQLSKGKPFLYWASEPSDYASKEGLEDRTYQDVHQLAVNYAAYEPSVTSFNLKDKEWMDFMAQKQLDVGNPSRRLSVFGMKEPQLIQLRMRASASEEKASEARGNFREIEFTAQAPTGETVRHVKGMGKSFQEQENVDDIPKSGIACVDGTLLTPRGIYNLFVVPISREYPQGTIIVPLEEISDEPVKEGDNLKEVMRRSVMWGTYSHEGGLFKNEEGEYEDFQRYIGKFPKRAMIYGKYKKYRVDIDQKGNILKADELDYRPGERPHLKEKVLEAED